MDRSCNGAMEKMSFIRKVPQLFSNTGGYFPSIAGRDVGGSNRRVLLFLVLLNVVLLIVAVALGIKCAKVKEGSLHSSHSAAVQLINELEYLHSNHSDVMVAEEEAKKALEAAINNHTLINTQIETQKNVNGGYQKQVETLRTEKSSLQSNISALEGSCGKCLPGWLLHNSSCYFFSYLESPTVKKSWPDSRTDCVGRGADLVVIDNQEEQTFASDNIKSMKTAPGVWDNGFWVGLTDREEEGTWVWINNVTEVEQRYWMNGEPNNHGIEDCGVIIHSTTNPWKTRYDGQCQYPLHWICEMPQNKTQAISA